MSLACIASAGVAVIGVQIVILIPRDTHSSGQRQLHAGAALADHDGWAARCNGRDQPVEFTCALADAPVLLFGIHFLDRGRCQQRNNRAIGIDLLPR